jgi:hypothetical protein
MYGVLGRREEGGRRKSAERKRDSDVCRETYTV